MSSYQSVLIWADLEMTGLDPEIDEIIEVALVATDQDLCVLSDGPQLVIHQPESRLQQMDQWNTEHHRNSGLWDLVLQSKLTLQMAEAACLEFALSWGPKRTMPLCGNSIWQDRRFLAKKMPRFEEHLHYRVIDVSSLKELYHRWYQGMKIEKESKHRAIDDIRESIDELRFYRRQMFR